MLWTPVTCVATLVERGRGPRTDRSDGMLWRSTATRGLSMMMLLSSTLAPLRMLLSSTFFRCPAARASGAASPMPARPWTAAITCLSFPKGRCPRMALCCPSAPVSDYSQANRRPAILPVALKGLGELKQRKRRWFRSHTLANPRRQSHRPAHATPPRGVRASPSPCPRRSAAR